MIDAKLLEILSCPACQGDVMLFKAPAGENKIICTQCGRKYPIKNGIPVLIADQGEK